MFRAKGKRPKAELSQADNPSARAMARASWARTHHYQLPQHAMACHFN